MCELFGVSSAKEIAVDGYLDEFFRHSKNHPHGWGLAMFSDNQTLICKEPVQASASVKLREILSQPVQVTNAFAHIRYATIGNIEYTNCHPYTGRDETGRQWTLIHNGTIFDYPPLEPYLNKQRGDTDSERILLYILDQMNLRSKESGDCLSAKERFELLEEIIKRMSRGNKLNLLLYDGEIMYIHSNFVGFLHYLKKKDTVIFSTLPLDGGDWQRLPYMRLLGYRNGELLFEGEQHEYEYQETEENLKFLYQIFANL